ncbi:MAG: Calx-beta domain-containing protein, partial [Crocosphaera sp.]
VDISVIGKGSVVDLPRLTAFNGKDVYLPSFIEVKNDATLKAQKLATIKQVDLYADNSKLELLGLNNLTGIDDNVVKARNQGKLTLAAKTISGDVDITAIGKDSLVDLSGLKNFNGKDVYLPSFIEAKNNGVIKASRLESLEQVDLYADNGTIQLSGVKDLSLNGIDDNAIKATNQGKLTLGAKTLSGDVDITSSGEGSVVNLPKLTRFLGKDVYLPSFIEAKNGGKVKANKLTTVTNVDPLDIDIASEPNITISDTTVTEGNKGRKNAKFTVNLDSESDKTVKVNYATANDTAKAGKDYQKTIGTLTFKPGQTKKTITVPILGDTLDESNKKFNVNLSKPRNAKLGDKGGIGTIRDNDHGTPKLSIGNESIVEGNKGRKNAKFTVTLDSKTDETVKVNYATADGSAKAGKDYRKINGTLTFKPGQTKKTITVPVLGDTIDESDEKFNVDLSKPRNAEFGDKRGIGTIRDNDEKTPNNNDSKSNEKGSVHVIYINGVNTTNKQYKDSLPLIEKLLEETDIKNDYILYENTYNKGGRLVFDLAQSALQAFVPGDFNDFEGINFRENVVKQIKNIDQRETKEGKCEDNPRAKFLIIAHSQGNFFAEEIYNKLPANIKNRTKILAMAPFTNFKGISNNNFDYLLREDDYPNVFKGVWGIAVPNDKSNLPKWPGKPDGLPEGADKEAHDLENYLNPNRYSKGTQKDKLVEESFNMAKNGINNLMKFDSGHYKNNEQGCVEVTASFKPSGNPWAISKLYLVSPERKYIGTAPNSLSGLGNDAGKTVSLGKFAPGTKLKFETKVTMFDDLDHTEQIDKFTLSSTNRREAKLDQWWGGYGTLGFEDSYSGEAFGAQAEKPNDFNDTEVYLNGANFKGNNIIVREAYFWE